jgi:hypothetical protein
MMETVSTWLKPIASVRLKGYSYRQMSPRIFPRRGGNGLKFLAVQGDRVWHDSGAQHAEPK